MQILKPKKKMTNRISELVVKINNK